MSRKGVFIPDITVEMFKTATLESVEEFMVSGQMENIEIPEKPHGEWIPCEERLPVDLKDVLVWYEYYNYKFNKLKQTYGIGWIYEGMWNGDVCGEQARCIAWMPLPQPYEKDGDNNEKNIQKDN